MKGNKAMKVGNITQLTNEPVQIRVKSKLHMIKPDAALFFYFPDGECEYKIAVHAMDWALTVSDMDNFLREKLKYGHHYKTADDALEDVRNTLQVLMDNYNINIDMIE